MFFLLIYWLGFCTAHESFLQSSIINSNFGVTECLQDWCDWLFSFVIYLFGYAFMSMWMGQRNGNTMVCSYWSIFFKKEKHPWMRHFFQMHQILFSSIQHFILKMSIERFKASLESCPISISMTYGCFHWPVFVLNTILAVSRVFRGSSFALEIRTCYLLWLYIYIFFSG